MKTEIHQFKYQKHGEKQYLSILSTAEKLFVEKGIDAVSLTDIARECGIMRSTFYRYFSNKNEIIWSILHQCSTVLSEEIFSRFEKTSGSTYERFKTYLDILYEHYLANPKEYVFYSLIWDDYQTVTSEKDNLFYNRFFSTDEFRSGDTVKVLIGNFDDGSVKPGLDPQKTAVSIVYSAMSILTSMSRQIRTLPAKYAVDTEAVIRFSFDALLAGIKA